MNKEKKILEKERVFAYMLLLFLFQLSKAIDQEPCIFEHVKISFTRL